MSLAHLLFACAMPWIGVHGGGQKSTVRHLRALGVTSPESAVRPRLEFINDPVPVTSEEMAKVDVTGAQMMKTQSDEMTFYTYPREQDVYVSGAFSPTGYFEKPQSDQICAEFSNLGGTADFLDVGANIGTWSIPMARCLMKLKHGGSVIAIEAMPAFAQHLMASAHANAFDNINLFNYAVGEGGALDTLAEKLDPTNKGGSYIDPNGGGATDQGTVPVKMTTLDAILRDRLGGAGSKIFAMKMDIENFEYFALQGASRFLHGDNRPCIIKIELRVAENEPSAKAMQLLKDSGYKEKNHIGAYDYILHREDFEACKQKFSVEGPRQ